MTSPKPDPIFSANARQHKRERARAHFEDHDFIHKRAAEDVVDRFETVLKRFENVLLYGPGAPLTAKALTPKANVGKVTIADDISNGEDMVVAAAEALPFSDQQFDAVASVMALHAVNDLPKALAEARRVLKPDGLFIGIFPGERTLHELRWALQTAEAEVTGRVAPRVLPFVAVKDGGALLQRAGFALPVGDVLELPITYQNPMRLFADLRGAGETSHLKKGPKGGLRRDVLAHALTLYQKRFPSEDGGVHVTLELVALTGWAPHASQPQPLKPGSATASLQAAIQHQE